eukprot:2037870-Rhodomonas_salina.3
MPLHRTSVPYLPMPLLRKGPLPYLPTLQLVIICPCTGPPCHISLCPTECAYATYGTLPAPSQALRHKQY